MIGIYAITNLEATPEKIYFGQSINIGRRLVQHKRLLNKQDKKCNEFLQKDWNSYGQGAFHFALFRLVNDNNQLNYWEAQAIKEAKELGMGVYNTSDPMNAGVLSEEVRKKISDKRKGFNLSEETKKKLSIWRTGTKQSKEHKEKISKSLLGNKRCEGHKQSDLTKRKRSETHKQIGHKPPSSKGIPKSEKHKQNISLALTGHKKSKQHNENNSKAHKLYWINKKRGINGG